MQEVVACALFCLLFSVFFCEAGNAAVPDVIPGAAAPAHVGKNLAQPETENIVSPDMVPTIQAPTSHVTGKMAITFTLKQVVIEGATIYLPGTFDALYKGLLGQTIMLVQARDEIARKITARYRKDGYVLSLATIPDQSLSEGILHIRIVEGFIDKVIIQNDRPDADRRNLIQAYGNRISANRPLNQSILERYLLLINDLPGMSARGTIRPSPDKFGAADLVIDVKNKTVDAAFTSDNRGNNYLGPFQEQLALTENSALGLDERTTVRGVNTIPTPDLHYFAIENEEQIDSNGTRLLMQYSSTMTRPHGSLSYLNLEGTLYDYSATISHPFLRSLSDNLTGRFVLDARDTESDSFGMRQYNDRTRAIRLGGNYSTHDFLKASDQLDVAISQGLSWPEANAGAGTSRPNSQEDFTKFNLDLARIQTLPASFSLLTAVSGQYCDRPLSISEQFQLGGVGFGQAYDAGEVSGDSGLAGKIELRYDQLPDKAWLSAYQLYSYYDFGSVRLNNMGPQADNMLSLASAGGGIRSSFTSWLSGYAEIGFPLTRDVASDNSKEPRFFFSLTARY